MRSDILLTLYLGLFLLEFLIDWFLDILNLNESLKNRDSVPAMFTAWIDADRYRRSIEYTQRKGKYGLLNSLWSRLVLLLVLFSGSAAILDSFLTELHLPIFVHGLVFLSLSSAALAIVHLPGSLYSRFVIEEEFGFNKTSVGTYLSDTVKQAFVGLVLLTLLLGGITLIMNLTGPLWWLAAWAFWAVFQLLMVVLYPMVIAPLFNRFEELPEGKLNDRLTALAERTGFTNRGIYVMDGSRRSRHSNAYFTGLGRFRRIVIFDTLVEALTEEELEAVLAHEIGHWKHGHIRRRLILSLLLSVLLFASLGSLLPWQPLYDAFGLGSASLHSLLFWLSFYSAPLGGLMSPLGNRRSRKHEYQADAFAAAAVNGSAPMIGALMNLGKDNLSNLTPHRAYSAWHYSHPSLKERVTALRAADSDGAPAPQGPQPPHSPSAAQDSALPE